MTLEEFLERLDIDQLKIDLKLSDTGDSTEYDEDQPLITIANQKNKGSVMNIALPGEVAKPLESYHYANKEPERVAYVEPIPEELRANSFKQPINMVANQIALNDMRYECTDDLSAYSPNKRSMIQRKAKMNHAF